ncbi:hypothetical protein CROQUDRAFT_669423 [Cronartium quercuum f. sp. fusiforme G11]|uniref:Cyanate lyase C-terminal domain-containing protein n=1 Tax=Cronartium quercuum f. sp. fusiforme G11 TaxID=708437 RepID=A0A9P6NNI3_9BASI|nr:hypothetical protein CROQUDRAFT_669423 [Cronartium quercuum f. sp. fusiforme G11]
MSLISLLLKHQARSSSIRLKCTKAKPLSYQFHPSISLGPLAWFSTAHHLRGEVKSLKTHKVLKQTPQFCSTLFDAKLAKSLSFSEIAKEIERSEVWTAALFYGQAKPEPKDLEALSKTLEIKLQILVVFGYPIKAIIHEKFGDGIMSAIDFNCDVKKVKENDVERVNITLNGKWLPYTRW